MVCKRGLVLALPLVLISFGANAQRSDVVRQMIVNTGQTFRYLSGADFHAQAVADYKSKGELIRRLGLASQ